MYRSNFHRWKNSSLNTCIVGQAPNQNYQQSLIFHQKSSIFHQKSPAFHQICWTTNHRWTHVLWDTFIVELNELTCRALLIEYRALLTEYRALLIEYRALLIEYRALLIEYRALLIECRDIFIIELNEFSISLSVYDSNELPLKNIGLFW